MDTEFDTDVVVKYDITTVDLQGGCAVRALLFAVFVVLSFGLAFSKVVVWFSWEGFDLFEEMSKRFEEETGIELEIHNVRKVDQKFALTLKSSPKLLPDVVLFKNDQIGLFEDSLEPLSMDLDGISGKALRAFTLDGKLLAVPIYFDVGGVIFYNEDLVEDPSGKSFEELVDLGKGRGYGFLVPVYGTSFFQIFQRTFGKKDVVGDKPYFLDDSTIEALRFLEWIIRETGKVSMDRYGQMTAFREGKAPLFMFGSFLIPSFEGRLNYGLVRIPVVKSAGRKLVPYLDFKGFAVVEGRMRDEVREFLRYVASKDFQMEFCERLYKLPTREDVQNRLSSKNDTFKRLLEYAKNGEPTPTSRFSGLYYQAVRGILGLLIRGEYNSLEDLAKKAQDFVDENVR